MFGSEMLEIGIGVIFVFLLVSLICTAVREGIEAWLNTRAAYLEHGIRELLHDTSANGLARALYEHPMVYSLYSGKYTPAPSGVERKTLANGAELPSYIPKKNFSTALMDLAARGPVQGAVTSGADARPLTVETMRANIANIQNPAVQRVLLTALDAGGKDLERVRTHIEAWYDSGMDRVSGWYKRSTQMVLFFTGLAVAVALNVNVLTIADYLSRNDTARREIVARAGVAASDTTFLHHSYEQNRKDLEALRLPIGWDHVDFGIPGTKREVTLPARAGRAATTQMVPRGAWDYVVSPLLGWFMVAFAATLGAPFWFDLLNKFMVIRSTVKPHEKSPEEASEDRQQPKRTPGSGAGDGDIPAEPGTTNITVNTNAPAGEAGTGVGSGGGGSGGSGAGEGVAGTSDASGSTGTSGSAGGTGSSGATGTTAPAGTTGASGTTGSVADDDAGGEHEACGAAGSYVTPDEELPAAEGGVA